LRASMYAEAAASKKESCAKSCTCARRGGGRGRERSVERGGAGKLWHTFDHLDTARPASLNSSQENALRGWGARRGTISSSHCRTRCSCAISRTVSLRAAQPRSQATVLQIRPFEPFLRGMRTLLHGRAHAPHDLHGALRPSEGRSVDAFVITKRTTQKGNASLRGGGGTCTAAQRARRREAARQAARRASAPRARARGGRVQCGPRLDDLQLRVQEELVGPALRRAPQGASQRAHGISTCTQPP